VLPEIVGQRGIVGVAHVVGRTIYNIAEFKQPDNRQTVAPHMTGGYLAAPITRPLYINSRVMPRGIGTEWKNSTPDAAGIGRNRYFLPDRSNAKRRGHHEPHQQQDKKERKDEHAKTQLGITIIMVALLIGFRFASNPIRIP